MQLMYGNDGTNYKVFAKSINFPLKTENLIKSNYMHYNFTKHSELYSSIENEPETMFYVTSNFNDSFENEQVMVVKCGHMTQFLTPCFFSHVYLKEIDKNYYKRQFFEIFNFQFVKSCNINLYNNKNIDGFKMEKNLPERYEYLSKKQLIAILSNFIYYESIGKETKILVDKCGNYFNQRAREILISIYSHLPYSFRKKYGFLIYANGNKMIPARISFLLFNKDEFIDLNNEFIDLNNIDLKQVERQVGKDIYIYASYLANLSYEQSDQYFDELEKKYRLVRFRLSDYITNFTKESKWQEGNVIELLPEWIKYVNKMSFRKDISNNPLINIIRNRLNSQLYNEYVFCLLKSNSFLNLSRECIQALRLTNVINEIVLDVDRFNDWYELDFKNRNNNKLKNNNLSDNLALVKKLELYENEKSLLLNSNLRIEQLDKWINEKVSFFENKISQYKEESQDYIDAERDMILKEIYSFENDKIDKIISKLIKIEEKIYYEENKLFLKDEIQKIFLQITNQYIDLDYSLNQCQNLYNSIEIIEDKIKVDLKINKTQLIKLINDKKNKLSINRVNIVKRKDFIKVIEVIRELNERKMNEKIIILFGQDIKKEMSLDLAKTLASIILIPGYNNRQYIREAYDILFEDAILNFLMCNHCFLMEHFLDLLNHINDPILINPIFSYFCTNKYLDYVISNELLEKGLEILKTKSNDCLYRKANEYLKSMKKFSKSNLLNFLNKNKTI